MTILQTVAGKVGKAINVLGNTKPVGSPYSYNQIAQKYVPNLTLSSSLQNYGGNPGQPFAWVPAVKTVSASELPKYDYSGSQSIYDPYAGTQSTQNYANPTNTNKGNGSSYNIPTYSQPDYSNIQNQTNDYGSIIDQEYNNTMGYLGAQEQGLISKAGTAQSQIESENANIKAQLGQEQATQESGVQAELAAGEKQGSTSMMQARDVWRQMTQENTAQLSALGISSSSVAEALAEKLGIETARRIASVSDSIGAIRMNATKELGRIKNFYQGKLTTLETEKANNLKQIQLSLLEGLNQINYAKNQAATAKAQARLDLFTNAQNIIGNLKSQYEQFQMELYKWAATKTAAIEPIVQDPNYFQKLAEAAQTLNTQFSASGFGYAPSYSYDKYGTVTGKITPYKKPEEETTGEIDYTNPSAWQNL